MLRVICTTLGGVQTVSRRDFGSGCEGRLVAVWRYLIGLRLAMAGARVR